MVTSQMAAFTRDFGMGDTFVFGVPLLPLALSIDRITNGLTRPCFGWLSDRVGRENTMVIAYGAGDRLGAGRTGGGPRSVRLVDAGVRHHHRDELRDGAAVRAGVEADAPAVVDEQASEPNLHRNTIRPLSATSRRDRALADRGGG